MVDLNEIEQDIFKAWHIIDDINTVIEGVLEHDFTPDQTANALQGIVEIYELRFHRMHSNFQQMSYPKIT
jgi:hypothetical protein